ncbi:replication initiator [Asanoa iriomotensis]|uniref:Plasmid replication initiator protein n=1 Tax=Asanoa iriomotensis TaxID=234613 RepID=A0ABQ4CFJ4_9ACTN|nr:replication initiator [Asanoa iriomotensis]GIF61529.1 hypothetical protein Air01nite_76240 [Asanoa iriomotensis]
MTVSTLTVVPETHVSGTAPCAEPTTVPSWYARSPDVRLQAIARAARDDYPDWLDHVRAAAACTRPIRLAGDIYTVARTPDRAVVLEHVRTADMPDGVIYKPCGNRSESVCPSCSARYKRDAYQIVRTMLVGGDGVPDTVARHPGLFATFTAPSFGTVHTRWVKNHTRTCRGRKRCDCRPEPCHARRDLSVCRHGKRLVCFARHADTDAVLGSPLCPDCYDYAGQAVWNLESPGELWRRTNITINRHLARTARSRGIDPRRIKLVFGKAAEMQRRAAIHFHAVIRLDGFDPDDPDAILPPPDGLDADDLKAAVRHAVAVVGYRTDPHTANRDGWPIVWGEQVDTKTITVTANGEITAEQVAAYVAKYATKSTEVTGHVSGRLTAQTVDAFADPDGTHTARLIDACWTLGRPRWPLHGPVCPRVCAHRSCAAIAEPPAWHPTLSGPLCPPGCAHRSCAEIAEATRDPSAPWRRLRRYAHRFGFGGHFLTKSRRHRVTFALKRQQRTAWRRRTLNAARHPAPDQTSETTTTVVVNLLQMTGIGWHTTADAILANTSAALAREHQQLARTDLAALAA